MTGTSNLGEIVDTRFYPIDQQASAEYLELVRRLNHELESEQVCTLPGFLLDSVRQSEIDRVKAELPRAIPARSSRNVSL